MMRHRSKKTVLSLIVFLVGFLCANTFASAFQATEYQSDSSASQPKNNEIRVAELGKVPLSHGPSTRQIVKFQTSERPGTIIISNKDRTLHLITDQGQAARYEISVGRDGFSWTGITRIGRKAPWPEWRPPGAMRKRQPSLPVLVPSGPLNPLGARALYLFDGGRDTLFRIHGTNNAAGIGGYETSGCFRMTNTDVMELYNLIKIGAKVVVK